LRKTWYPDEKFIVETHEEVLRAFGGHPGFERGTAQVGLLLEKVRKTNGTHRKAAVLLLMMIRGRIFCDRNHRTAAAVAKAFLERNGKKTSIRLDDEETKRFIRDIISYNFDQIAARLEEDKLSTADK
jgi:prophage maintenance system killer protein